MRQSIHAAGLALALISGGVPAAAQTTPAETLQRHGVAVKAGEIESAFDALAAPTVAVTPGAFAGPLALLAMPDTRPAARVEAAYAFAILAGRFGRAASEQELAAAGQALVGMVGSADRRSRIAGARVAGRLFAVPLDRAAAASKPPLGLIDGLFALLNQEHEIEQLAAMDAIGLLREATAVSSLSDRYRYYRDANKRSLAGGALEALARIGDPSTAALLTPLAGDRWAEGNDPTALAVAFARERILKDGSIAVIRQALDDRSRRTQARGYLAELGVAVP
jgi:hypothetical protein